MTVSSCRAAADAVRRRHRVHAGNPAAAARDGWVLRAHLAGNHALTGALRLRLSAGFARHRSRAGYERHDEFEIGAGLEHAFADPTGLSERPWSAALGLTRTFSRYDAPDPTIDPDTRRRQRALSAEVSLTVPLGERSAVLVSLGHRTVDASLPNYEHENRRASAAIAWSF